VSDDASEILNTIELKPALSFIRSVTCLPITRASSLLMTIALETVSASDYLCYCMWYLQTEFLCVVRSVVLCLRTQPFRCHGLGSTDPTERQRGKRYQNCADGEASCVRFHDLCTRQMHGALSASQPTAVSPLRLHRVPPNILTLNPRPRWPSIHPNTH
jgi:hypothetical protein